MKPTKAKIKIVPSFVVEINGEEYPARFQVKSEWNGMIELENTGQSADSLIIHEPNKMKNSYDFLPKMLGGNLPNGQAVEFEVEVIKLGHNLLRLLPKEVK